jgi:hypothetical protein
MMMLNFIFGNGKCGGIGRWVILLIFIDVAIAINIGD